MTNKIFLITLALVLALVSIGLSPGWNFPAAADFDYYYAVNAVMDRCGPNVQLLAILMEKRVTKYAFTHGGSANEYVTVDYDFKTHTVDTLKIGDLRQVYYFSFPDHQNTRPIPLEAWKVSSGQAFKIVSKQHGFENLNDFLPLEIVGQQEIAGGLLLHQEGGSIVWNYIYSNRADEYEIHINATTGQVISSSSRTLPPL